MPAPAKRALANKCWRASKLVSNFLSKFILRNALILSALLALTACGGAPARPAITAAKPAAKQPAPGPTLINASAKKAAVAPQQAVAPKAPALKVAAAAPVVQPAPVQTASQTPAEPMTPPPPVTLNVVLTANDYVPALAAEDNNNNDGFIDWQACVRGFTGGLATGQAGQTLLADNGLLLDSDNVVDPLLNPVNPVNPVIVTAEARPAETSAAPAPSAGAPETPPGATVSLHLKPGQTESLLVSAYEQAGRHYKVGGQAPATGFDSAGFTRWVYGQRGIHLPSDAKTQAAGGRQVAKDDLRPGDLLVFRDPSVKQEDYHVGIYTGQGHFIHAAAKAGLVTETDAFGPQYSPYFLGARRYFDDPQAAPLTDSRKMAAASLAVKVALAELSPSDKPVMPAPPAKAAKSKSKSKGKK
ncbi:MAG: C40 family peptidase [Candidatus Adiutrix sp.]|jgi:cell wall-associated NlpC family hydrolase|nr:C40 family peptidase [Candidatus Adiutrix sp.]